MKKHSRGLVFLFGIVGLFLTFASCKKINEATDIGGDLIPQIDNVNTFDTTLEVQTFNKLFTRTTDSTRSNISVTQFLGSINNDPLFGKTEASLFFELLPTTLKTPFPFDKSNLIELDSIVLVLNYTGLVGDSVMPQQVRVYEIANDQHLKGDSSYLIRNEVFTAGQPLGPTKTFLPKDLNDSVTVFREKAKNQLRIPLDKSFGFRLLNYDSTTQYISDSAFKTYFNGFAVVPENNGMGNGLISVNISDTNTKLAIYTRYKNGDKTDTAVTYFRPKISATTGGYATGSANLIKRDYSGAEIANSVEGDDADDLLYIQNAPGSYATIKIPGLAGLSNRLIHRAELIVEQVHHPSDNTFTTPTYLYLDAVDSSIQSYYRTIPYDAEYSPSTSQIDLLSFGGVGKLAQNNSYIWRFNLSRYVQHVVNGTEPVYTLRLSSPFYFSELISLGGSASSGTPQFVRLNPTYTAGRVRLGGGNHPDQKMRLRIVYSKL